MRTSRASKDTAKILQALSPSTSRQTRSSSNGSLRGFAFNQPTGATDAMPPVKEPPANSDDDDDDDDASSLSSMDTVDMEDILERPLKRRKANPAATSQKAPGKTIAGKTDKNTQEAAKAPPRKVKPSKGPLKMDPPPNWDRVYETVKKMRQDNPTAPVDTMGCAELYWRGSSPRDRRFQTLIALMLSSQTKDTVTAVAMQRLHTELGESKPTPQPSIVKVEDDDDKKASPDFKDSTLTLENILTVSPQRLNELIRAVGFHNNKTKYIKAVAPILQEQYHSDIPSTAEDLMSLPGVGPKMAYLCMSAAWGKHEGIGVDVHVHRITNLFGWHKTKTPEETRMALESWLPREKWHEINKLLVGLGQTVCLPVARRCDECYLSGLGLCKGEIKGLKSKKPDRTAVKKGDRSSGEPGIKIEAEP